MLRFLAILSLLSTSLAFIACTDEGSSVQYEWDLPDHFPQPNVPDDNPMSVEKAELGRHLFYDTRLSVNSEMSCGTCHQQSLAFTDGLANAEGTTGEIHPRSTMSLTNVAYNSRLTWANPLIDRLSPQALGPLFGDAPIEMGLNDGNKDDVLASLEQDTRYRELFARAYPNEAAPFTFTHITRAIASFQRTLISADAPFDRYMLGDVSALSDSEKRGLQLFFSERLECFHCHGGFNFTDSADHEGKPTPEIAFHNTGLYNIDGEGAYPPENTGTYAVTGNPEDMGRFRAPSLRNIALTAPYMHDGSIATLEEVIDHYAAGGRTIAEGPHAGVGSENPLKSEFLVGFIITDEEKTDLRNFLESLTDEAFVTNPAFADPF